MGQGREVGNGGGGGKEDGERGRERWGRVMGQRRGREIRQEGYLGKEKEGGGEDGEEGVGG
jgi:hypothetical protein